MVWAVIPVKRLESVKQRLAKELSPEGRKRLYLAMLFDVLDSLVQTPSIKGISVVTPDSQVEAIVCSYQTDVHIIKETGSPSLNGALRQAARSLQKSGVTHMLVVPGDLPLLKPDEVGQIVACSSLASVIIVPDKTWSGTNGLLLKLPTSIRLSFGPNSFQAHLMQARTRGVSNRVCPLPSLSWDIDHFADLTSVIENGRGTKTYQEMLRQGIYRYFIHAHQRNKSVRERKVLKPMGRFNLSMKQENASPACSRDSGRRHSR